MFEWIKRKLGKDRAQFSRTTYGDNVAMWPFSQSANDEKTALGVPALFNGLQYIGATYATFPVELVRQTGRHTVPADEKGYEALLDLLNTGSNYDAHTVKAAWIRQTKLWGNGYLGISRDKNGNPSGLHVLDSRKVVPFVVEGLTFFYFSKEDLRQKTEKEIEQIVEANPQNVLAPDDVLHLTNNSVDGIKGVGIMDVLRGTVGNAKSIEDFATRYYNSGTLISGWLGYDGELTVEQRKAMRESIAAFRGISAEQAFSLLIVEYGGKLNALPVSAEVAQLVESKRLSILDAANMLGLSAYLLNSPEAGKYSNIQQLSVEVYRTTFAGLVAQAEAQMLKLLSAKERAAGLRFHFRIDYLDASHNAEVTDAVIKQWQAGLLKRNEARLALGQQPDAQNGDTYLVPAGSAGTEQGQPAAEPHMPEAMPKQMPEQMSYKVVMPLVGSLLERVDTKTAKAFESRANKPAAELTPWANVFSEEQAEYARETLTSISTTLQHFGKTLDADRLARNYGDQIKRRASGRDYSTLLNIVLKTIKGE